MEHVFPEDRPEEIIAEATEPATAPALTDGASAD